MWCGTLDNAHIANQKHSFVRDNDQTTNTQCYTFFGLENLCDHLSNIPRQLRSSISQLIVPKTKLNLGTRAFSVCAPMVWNELPITLKTSETIAIFRKKLKSFIPN